MDLLPITSDGEHCDDRRTGYLSFGIKYEALRKAECSFTPLSMFNETSVARDRIVLPPPSFALCLAAALFAVVTLFSVIFSSNISKDTEIYELGCLSILTAWPFFRRRYDFLKSNFAKTGLNMFSFKVLHVTSAEYSIFYDGII